MFNPVLYEFLRRKDPGIRIKDPGVTGDYRRTTELKTLRSGKQVVRSRYKRQEGGRHGETYVLNCPFCGDKRKRFFASYLFGRRDSETNQRITVGLHCFRRDCQSDWSNVEEFLTALELFEEFSVDGSMTQHVGDEELEGSGHTGLQDLPVPGNCVALTDLAWNHPAVDYLRFRGLDLAKLNDYYGVRLIERGHQFRAMDGRIFIPFYRSGGLLGYTARHTPDLSPPSERKYLNSPGSLGGYMYGLNGAARYPVVAMVEGPIDKWVMGDASVALLNKSLGYEKQQRLLPLVKSGSVELIVLVVDPKQSDRESEAGDPHHMDKLLQTVQSLGLVNVLPVWLPESLDVGACHGYYLAEYLENYLGQRGYQRLGQILARSVRSTSAAC